MAAAWGEPDFSYTSRTRNLAFQFERDRAPFFGWTKCTYKVQQFSYRRLFAAR